MYNNIYFKDLLYKAFYFFHYSPIKSQEILRFAQNDSLMLCIVKDQAMHYGRKQKANLEYLLTLNKIIVILSVTK